MASDVHSKQLVCDESLAHLFHSRVKVGSYHFLLLKFRTRLISPLVAFVSLKKIHTIFKNNLSTKFVDSGTACAKPTAS